MNLTSAQRGMQSVSPAQPKTPGIGERLLVLALIGAPVMINRVAGITICPTAGLMGIPCPGCGLSRAAVAALHGHFHEAFYYHPLFFVLVPTYSGMVGYIGLSGLLGSRTPQLPKGFAGLITAISTVFIGLAFCLWVARFWGYFGGPVPVEPWFGDG